ncbi:prepilin-type N-terminal cleavage/methylation domain-containing protein [Paludibacterium paludis]|uniref:Type II secretion system protein GspH n=1 Tax=Paludibacterium paludis TaxID=1225769 RepID=A0A918NZN3_9NEIS|nr:prepilin-type N-terminal cleavage/methylation domain-containing protein [Paludibacterium paludis]GGY08119.1 type II secretion system protein GspH [Paludibacterium paludis]
MKAVTRTGQTGFTLIEILVVLVIIGVLSATVTLSMRPDTHRQMEDEAYRFARILEQAADASEQGDALGLVWLPRGYAFRRLGEDGRWQPVGDDFFKEREWPEGIVGEAAGKLPGGPILLWQEGQGTPLHLVLRSETRRLRLELTPLGRVEVGDAS